MLNIQEYQTKTDTLPLVDSINPVNSYSFKLVKLIPAHKISNTEGAIIPKEAVQMVKLQPSTHRHEIGILNSNTFIVLGIVISAILIFGLIWMKFKKKSKA